MSWSFSDILQPNALKALLHTLTGDVLADEASAQVDVGQSYAWKLCNIKVCVQMKVENVVTKLTGQSERHH